MLMMMIMMMMPMIMMPMIMMIMIMMMIINKNTTKQLPCPLVSKSNEICISQMCSTSVIALGEKIESLNIYIYKTN